MSVQVFVLGGRDVGRSYTVEDTASLGRSPECEIALRDRSISRVHARLVREGASWFLEDQQSRNGVRHNGKRVRRVEVRDRDEFLLGELPIRICLDAPETDGLPGLEFVDDAPAVVVVTRVPDVVPGGSGALDVPGPEQDDDAGEVEIEGLELDLDDALELQGVAGEDLLDEIDIEEPRSAEEQKRRRYELRRGEILASDSGRGFLRGDLAQQPAWKRMLAVAIVLGLFVAVFYFAFKGVELLRGGG